MMESRDGRRVVITGLGVLAPCGTGLEAFWEGLGKPAEPTVERNISDFDPQDYGLKYAEARRLDRFAQLAYAAGKMAIADGFGDDGLGQYDEWKRGVVMGTGIRGAHAWETNAQVLLSKGEKGVSPLTVPMVMPNAGAAAVSMRLGLRGPACGGRAGAAQPRPPPQRRVRDRRHRPGDHPLRHHPPVTIRK